MTTLTEFLAQRETELLDQIEDVRRSLHPLENELAQVRRAKAIISMEAAPRAPVSAFEEFDEIQIAPYAEMTMKQLTIKALRDHFPRGATAQKLISFFSDAWGRADVQRSSLSPQLTRLKQEGVIGLNGKTWYLVTDEKGPDETSEPDSSVGHVAERLNAPDLGSGESPKLAGDRGSVGSNPTVSAPFHRVAEDLLGGTSLRSASTHHFTPTGQKGG